MIKKVLKYNNKKENTHQFIKGSKSYTQQASSILSQQFYANSFTFML